MNISTRLQKIIDTIDPCETVADIGCDHGYVAISALKEGMAKRAVAADVARGPLDIARKNCEAEEVSDHISLMLSDGFSNIPDSADISCAVIAGMGGLLMERILRDGRLDRFADLRQLVLSPQSDLDAVRRLLIEELSYTIRTEYMVLDEGKYYYIMDVRIPAHANTAGINQVTQECTSDADDSNKSKACKAAGDLGQAKSAEKCGQYTEAEYMFGKHIAAESRDIYMEFIKYRQRIVEDALGCASSGTSEGAKLKAAALERELKLIEEARTSCI